MIAIVCRRRSRWPARIWAFQIGCATMAAATLSSHAGVRIGLSAAVMSLGIWIAHVDLQRARHTPLRFRWQRSQLRIDWTNGQADEVRVDATTLATHGFVLLHYRDAAQQRFSLRLFADQFSEADYAALLRTLHGQTPALRTCSKSSERVRDKAKKPEKRNL